jgi:hypothetical protein
MLRLVGQLDSAGNGEDIRPVLHPDIIIIGSIGAHG